MFGGSFWDGARDGLIVSGLNHLSQHGGEDGYGKLYGNETEAYNFMWKNAVAKDVEHSAYLLTDGVLVTPIMKNDRTTSYPDYYKIRNGRLSIGNKKYDVVGYMHTHQRLGDDGKLLPSASYRLSGEDQNYSIRLGKPVFSMGRDDSVYGVFRTGSKSVSHMYDFLSGYSTKGLLSGKNKLLNRLFK